MRNPTLALALSLLLAIAWFNLTGNAPRASEDAKPAVQKLEYRRLSWNAITTNAGQSLNDLGDQGWEMCGVIPGDAYASVIFKRPKQ